MGKVSKFRRNESYVLMSEYLVAQGYQFEPVRGSKHPYLLVALRSGVRLKFFFPATASDHRSAANALSQMKRLIREREASNDNAPKV